MIFPAAIRYQNELASTCANLKAVGYEFDTDTLDKITDLVKALQDGIAALETTLAQARRRRHARATPQHFCDDGAARRWLTVRKTADELEGMVADDLWPLPTYQEMLFIK